MITRLTISYIFYIKYNIVRKHLKKYKIFNDIKFGVEEEEREIKF